MDTLQAIETIRAHSKRVERVKANRRYKKYFKADIGRFQHAKCKETLASRLSDSEMIISGLRYYVDRCTPLPWEREGTFVDAGPIYDFAKGVNRMYRRHLRAARILLGLQLRCNRTMLGLPHVWKQRLRRVGLNFIFNPELYNRFMALPTDLSITDATCAFAARSSPSLLEDVQTLLRTPNKAPELKKLAERELPRDINLALEHAEIRRLMPAQDQLPDIELPPITPQEIKAKTTANQKATVKIIQALQQGTVNTRAPKNVQSPFKQPAARDPNAYQFPFVTDANLPPDPDDGDTLEDRDEDDYRPGPPPALNRKIFYTRRDPRFKVFSPHPFASTPTSMAKPAHGSTAWKKQAKSAYLSPQL